MRSDCVYEYVRFMKGWGFEMNLKDQMNGVQHVGVPTNDIETTLNFMRHWDLRSLSRR